MEYKLSEKLRAAAELCIADRNIPVFTAIRRVDCNDFTFVTPYLGNSDYIILGDWKYSSLERANCRCMFLLLMAEIAKDEEKIK